MNVDIWKTSLVGAMQTLWEKLAAFVPNLISAFVILLVGFFVSKLVQKISTKFLELVRLDRASQKVGVEQGLGKMGITKKSSELIGIVIFWLFMLTFMISATETLRLKNLSKTIDTLVLYIPNVITAALIFVLGLMLAHFLKNIILSATQRVSTEYAKLLAGITHAILIILVALLAIGQLQIEVGLLNRMVEIVMVAGFVALALSLGLGTRDLSKNVVAGVYAREEFELGRHIKVGEDEGKLKRVGTIAAIVEMKDGKTVHVPNAMLTETVVQVSEKA